VPIQVFIVDYSFRLSIDLRTDDYCFNLIIITLTTLSKSAISRFEYFHFKWFYQNYYCSAFAIWTIFYPEFVMIISTYKSPLSKFVCFLIAFGSVSSYCNLLILSGFLNNFPLVLKDSFRPLDQKSKVCRLALTGN